MDNATNKLFSVEINTKSKTEFDQCVTKIKENAADYGKITNEKYSNGETAFNFSSVAMFSAKLSVAVDENAEAYEFFKHIDGLRESEELEETYIKVEYIAPFNVNWACGYAPNTNCGGMNEPTAENADIPQE